MRFSNSLGQLLELREIFCLHLLGYNKGYNSGKATGRDFIKQVIGGGSGVPQSSHALFGHATFPTLYPLNVFTNLEAV